MDRALVERMVGAVVLVLLLVVVAPALLDGQRSSAPGDLDRTSNGEHRTEVIVLNAPPGSDAVATEPAAEQSSATAVPIKVPAAEPVASREPARVKPAGQTEGYAVQIGSFSRQVNARQFAASLSSAGFAVFVAPARADGQTVYRVYAGPRPSRDAAEKLAKVLGDAGHSTMVVDLGSTADGGGR